MACGHRDFPVKVLLGPLGHGVALVVSVRYRTLDSISGSRCPPDAGHDTSTVAIGSCARLLMCVTAVYVFAGSVHCEDRGGAGSGCDWMVDEALPSAARRIRRAILGMARVPSRIWRKRDLGTSRRARRSMTGPDGW